MSIFVSFMQCFLFSSFLMSRVNIYITINTLNYNVNVNSMRFGVKVVWVRILVPSLPALDWAVTGQSYLISLIFIFFSDKMGITVYILEDYWEDKVRAYV